MVDMISSGIGTGKSIFYEQQTWDYNIKNCNIPIERSIMISEDKFNAGGHALEAGTILGNLNITEYEMHHCGKWYWLEFEKEEDAMAFKLKWE